MPMFLLNDTNATGAVCLDGSPGAFYFHPATDPAAGDSWQIYLEGGGWCYDEQDCLARSLTNLGSTLHRPTAYPYETGSGLIDFNCDVNPDFCKFNRVIVMYCDGNSFAGNRSEPVQVAAGGPTSRPIGSSNRSGSGTSTSSEITAATPAAAASLLFFRGHRILKQTLAALATNFNMDRATTVLLTGCSAGGLAAIIHADYVHKELQRLSPRLTKFKALSMSGFFMDAPNLDGEAVYAEQMRSIHRLSGAAGAMHPACVAHFAASNAASAAAGERAESGGSGGGSGDESWRCNMAQWAYNFSAAPFFVVNGAVDCWQTSCILLGKLAAGFPDQVGSANGNCSAFGDVWDRCAGYTGNPNACNARELVAVNGYLDGFVSRLTALAPFARRGNGAFVHSCHTHCEANADAMFLGIKVGGTSIQRAIAAWWAYDEDAGAGAGAGAGPDPAAARGASGAVATAATPSGSGSFVHLPCRLRSDSNTSAQCNPTCFNM
jgi:STAM-binding protein